MEFYDLLWDQRERKYYKGIAKKNHRNESYQVRINYINYIKHRLRHSAGVLRPSPLTRDIHFLTSTVSHVRSEIYSSEPAVKDLRGELGLIASNSASEWRARPFLTRSGQDLTSQVNIGFVHRCNRLFRITFVPLFFFRSTLWVYINAPRPKPISCSMISSVLIYL